MKASGSTSLAEFLIQPAIAIFSRESVHCATQIMTSVLQCVPCLKNLIILIWRWPLWTSIYLVSKFYYYVSFWSFFPKTLDGISRIRKAPERTFATAGLVMWLLSFSSLTNCFYLPDYIVKPPCYILLKIISLLCTITCTWCLHDIVWGEFLHYPWIVKHIFTLSSFLWYV